MAVNKKKEAAKKEEVKEVVNHDIKVLRAHEFKSGDIGFDAEVNGIKLYGLTYIDTVEGRKNEEPFISFPSRKGSDGKYYNNFWFPVSAMDMENIEAQLEDYV